MCWKTAWRGGARGQGGFLRVFGDVVLLTSGEQSIISQGPKDTENRNCAPHKGPHGAWGPRQGLTQDTKQDREMAEEMRHFAWGPVIQQTAPFPIWLRDR